MYLAFSSGAPLDMTERTLLEHRWGERVAVDCPVLLQAGPGLRTIGRLRNASLSGGYLEIAIRVPLEIQVQVELEWRDSNRTEHWRIPAYGVRADDEGVGLEWCEFAPAGIAVLIASRFPTEPVATSLLRSSDRGRRASEQHTAGSGHDWPPSILSGALGTAARHERR